jgi:hypothetical protein
MSAAMVALEAAIKEAALLEKTIKAGRPRIQVTLSDERSLAKATALAWFNNHKESIASAVPLTRMEEIDDLYKNILEASERAGTRSKYLATIKDLRQNLVKVRSHSISVPAAKVQTVDQPPDFNRLISDHEMQDIILGRWDECIKCLEAKAPLAATVMMGGLLEALLLARINREGDKKHIFTAKSAPRDHLKKPKSLSEWGLKDFIDVVHEVKWITVSAKDVGAVLRDYRNYIHPQKQFSHGVHLKLEDAKLFWEVSKHIARQIIDSAP